MISGSKIMFCNPVVFVWVLNSEVFLQSGVLLIHRAVYWSTTMGAAVGLLEHQGVEAQKVLVLEQGCWSMPRSTSAGTVNSYESK